jgi:hypothetical protein
LISRQNATAINALSFAKKPELLTVGGANSLLPLLYGQQRIESGHIFTIGSDTANVTFGVAWCIGECEEVVSVTINDVAPPAGVTIFNYTGTAAQTADDWLEAGIAGYDDALPGICYSSITIDWDAPITGFPIFNAVIKGKKVSLVSGGTKTYSQNPAFILADLIENADYGLGAEVDWTSVAAAAAVCDALVGGLKKYQLDIILATSAPGADWIQNICDYARLFVVQEGTKYRIIPDVSGSSVKTFNTDNILEGSLRVSHPGRFNVPTMIEVVYTDASQIPYVETPYRTATVTPRRLSRIMRPGITRHAEAVRYAEDRLKDLEIQLAIGWTTFDETLALQVGDVVTLTHPVGFSSTLARISSINPTSPGVWAIGAIPINTTLSSATTAAPTPSVPIDPPPILGPDPPWDIGGRTGPAYTGATLSLGLSPIEDLQVPIVLTDTELFTIPPAYVSFGLEYNGPNPTDEDIVFVVRGAPAGIVSGQDSVYDGVGELERGYAYYCYVTVYISTYESYLLGNSFTIYAHTSDKAYKTPSAIVTFTSSHEPMILAPTEWFGWYVVHDPYVETFGTTYPAYQADVADYYYVSEVYGYDWEGPIANITWVVTQTAGTTLPLTVAHRYGWQWVFTRSLATDYSGTAYEIQFYTNGGADEWGPVVSISCET